VRTDEEFVRAFETATLPASEFDHAAHVRAGWWYLREYSLGEAIDRFRRSVRAFAAAQGATGKYHETVTVAWMLIVAERLAATRDLDWAAFATRHPDLFARPSLLTRYYTCETLASDRARGAFVMPDRPSHSTGASVAPG
jgi:hypothetical protein